MSDEAGSDEKLNALLVEVRLLEGTYNELSARQNLLEKALLEGRAALEAIKGLAQSNPAEVLVPLGGGVLARAQPPNIQNLLINVGSNVVVERSKEEALALMEGRAKEFENSIVSILSQRNQIAQRIESDRQVLQMMVSQQQPQKR